MAPRPPARIGDPVEAIDTPALVVDLAALDANIEAMARFAASSGLALRPHAKTHKSVAVARRQLAAGAIGLCCQKVSEAEALLPSGVNDLLVSNHIVGRAKLDRLAGIAGQIRVTTLTADAQHVAWLHEAATRHGTTIEVLIEIDAGDARMGLHDPGDAVDLGHAIQSAPGLKLRGLQAYSGPFQHLRRQSDRAAAAQDAARRAAHIRDALLDAGLPCDLITGGGTGSFADDAAAGVFTEIQPGSYVFMDGDYGRNLAADGGFHAPFAQSLFVVTEVLRVSAQDVVYVDAGVKALNLDCGMPTVHERPDLNFTKASDEQGRIETAPGGRTPGLGDRLMIVPSHCDPTVNQFDWMVALRNGIVEGVWTVDGRGCLT